jgi:hypothetical protein
VFWVENNFKMGFVVKKKKNHVFFCHTIGMILRFSDDALSFLFQSTRTDNTLPTHIKLFKKDCVRAFLNVARS